MRAILGHSDDIDSDDAIAEVIRQCKSQLGSDTPTAALLFMSVDYEHQQILDAIAATWPGLPLIGGTSDGEVSSKEGYVPDSVLLTLLCGDEFKAHAVVGRQLSADIAGAVNTVIDSIPADMKPSVALTTFAPTTDATEVLRQIDVRLPTTECPVFGGLTGGHRTYVDTKEFCNTEVLSDSLPMLLLSGDVQVSWGIGSGWVPIGPAFTVTACEGHLLRSIDGRPALDLYGQYYGDVPQGNLGEYPLAISHSGPDGPWQLRAVLGTDRDTGEVRLAGGVSEGSLVRMTEVVAEGVISGTMHSINDALRRFDGTPDVALLFTCAARKWVLGTQVEREIQTVLEALPRAASANLGLAGLYVYGEIAPPIEGAASTLHNETCITVLLGAA